MRGWDGMGWEMRGWLIQEWGDEEGGVQHLIPKITNTKLRDAFGKQTGINSKKNILAGKQKK